MSNHPFDADYTPPPRNDSPIPPDDGICRECFEWRQDGPHGYRWFRTCERPGQPKCLHAHHRDEFWIG